MSLPPRSGAKLGPAFEDALVYAARVHALQSRKGTNIPYIAHLLAVTSLVLENGGDADEAIAALLHDAAEDQGGRARLEDIRRRFGNRVAGIVEGCTDTFEDPKPWWLPRKVDYLKHLPGASPEVRRVALADKLHNARCILADFRAVGDRVWERFSAGKRDVLRYYGSLVEALRTTDAVGMWHEFERVVSELKRIANEQPTERAEKPVEPESSEPQTSHKASAR